MPRLTQAEYTGIDNATDTDASEPLTPVVELHPKRIEEKQGPAI